MYSNRTVIEFDHGLISDINFYRLPPLDYLRRKYCLFPNILLFWLVLFCFLAHLDLSIAFWLSEKISYLDTSVIGHIGPINYNFDLILCFSGSWFGFESTFRFSHRGLNILLTKVCHNDREEYSTLIKGSRNQIFCQHTGRWTYED